MQSRSWPIPSKKLKEVKWPNLEPEFWSIGKSFRRFRSGSARGVIGSSPRTSCATHTDTSREAAWELSACWRVSVGATRWRSRITPMRFRKLRIAWSVVCVVACVLLIVLWVRSLQWADMLTVRCGSEQTYYAVSFRGKVAVVPLPLSTNQQFDPAGNKVFPSGLVSRRFVGTGTLLRTNGKVTVHAFTNVGRTGEM